jgi:hypothetical protein
MRNGLFVVAVIATFALLFVFGIAPLVDRSNAEFRRAEAVKECKTEQYDTYQYVVSLGMRRLEAACAAAVFEEAKGKDRLATSRQAEKQCFIVLKDCSK